MGGSRATKEHLSACKENEDERGGKKSQPILQVQAGQTCISVKSPCWGQYSDSYLNVQCHLNATIAFCTLYGLLIW